MQGEGLANMNNALRRIDTITQAAAASSEENAAASAEMSGHAGELRQAVELMTHLIGATPPKS